MAKKSSKAKTKKSPQRVEFEGIMKKMDPTTKEQLKALMKSASITPDKLSEAFLDAYNDPLIAKIKDETKRIRLSVSSFATKLAARSGGKARLWDIHILCHETANPLKDGENEQATLYGTARLAEGESGNDRETNLGPAQIVISTKKNDKRGTGGASMDILDDIEEGNSYQASLSGGLGGETPFLWLSALADTTFEPIDTPEAMKDPQNILNELLPMFDRIPISELPFYLEENPRKLVFIEAGLARSYPSVAPSGWKMLSYEVTDISITPMKLRVKMPHTMNRYGLYSEFTLLINPSEVDEKYCREGKLDVEAECILLFADLAHPLEPSDDEDPEIDDSTAKETIFDGDEIGATEDEESDDSDDEDDMFDD